MHDHGFATVITQAAGVPWASHLPVLLDEAGGGPHGILRSHMARANEQWQHFKPTEEVLCIFNGPHSYISPTWYVSKMMVPTWNYATVHVYGFPQLVEEPASLRKILDDTVAKYEAKRSNPWKMEFPQDTVDGLMKAIVGFTLNITHIEAKFKLEQNRSVKDQAGMLQELTNSPDPESQSLAAFIQRQKKTGQ